MQPAAEFTYLYKSTDPAQRAPALRPEEPAVGRRDDDDRQGREVPFIVRVETGYIDRDQYQIAALFQPGKPWSAAARRSSSTTSC